VSKSSIRSYEVLLRIARVREARASLELAGAIREERAATEEVERASAWCGMAFDARSRCLQGHRAMGQYATYTELSESLHEQLAMAGEALAAASSLRREKAEQALAARRFADGVGRAWDDRRLAAVAISESRQSEQRLELWMRAKENA
jgi:hypothetical protein